MSDQEGRVLDIISRAKAFLSGREPPPFYQELAEALVREHERVRDSVLEAKEAEIEALRNQLRDLKEECESLLDRTGFADE
jgi:polyhydroxyalkanoate synthesis regulator phasin